MNDVAREKRAETCNATRVGIRQKLGYATGDLGQTLFFQATLLYLLYFYTDVAGIAPASVATILLVARMIDTVSNPCIGVLADRTRTRWGRFRPYLLLGAVPLGLTALATFTVVPGSAAFKEGYAIASYATFSICFAAVAIPYSALLGTMTADSRDRSSLGALRAGFSFSAGIIVSSVTLPIVSLADSPATGFHLAIGAFSVVGVVLIWTAFASTREAIIVPRALAPSLRESARALVSAPIVIFTALFLLTNLATMLRSAGAMYYFKYTLGRTELVSAYLTFGAVMTVIGIAAAPFVSRVAGKRGTMIVGLVMMAVGYALTSALPATVVATFLWLGFFVYFGFGLKAATTWPILADCVDYAEWRHGKRVEAIAYGFAIFSQKLSLALGGAIAGWILSWSGYVANAEQTADALRGIQGLVAFLPAACMVCAVVLALLYPLTDARVEALNAELRRHKRDS